MIGVCEMKVDDRFQKNLARVYVSQPNQKLNKRSDVMIDSSKLKEGALRLTDFLVNRKTFDRSEA